MSESKIYCLKCRKKVNPDGPTVIKRLKNGRFAQVGICPTCRGKVFKFVSKERGLASV